MIRLILIAAFMQLFAVSTFAQTKIIDSKNLLPEIRLFAGVKSFDQAFACASSAKFKTQTISCDEIACDADACWSMCSEADEPLSFNRSVVNCSADSVSIFNDLSGDLTDLTAASFAESNNNLPEFLLTDLGRFTNWQQANVYLTEVKSTPFTLARGTANERKVEAINISFEFGADDTQKLQGIISILKESPGIAQVGRLRLNENTFFLLDDFGVQK